MARNRSEALARLLERRQALLAHEGVVEGGEAEAIRAMDELAELDRAIARATVAGGSNPLRKTAQALREPWPRED